MSPCVQKHTALAALPEPSLHMLEYACEGRVTLKILFTQHCVQGSVCDGGIYFFAFFAALFGDLDVPDSMAARLNP